MGSIRLFVSAANVNDFEEGALTANFSHLRGEKILYKLYVTNHSSRASSVSNVQRIPLVRYVIPRIFKKTRQKSSHAWNQSNPIENSFVDISYALIEYTNASLEILWSMIIDSH